MADILLYYKTHYYDLISQEKQNEINKNRKFDARNKKGDIIQIKESPFFQNYKNPAFRVINITDRTCEQIEERATSWERAFTAKRIKNDIENGRFEYEIEIIKTSISGDELFQSEEVGTPPWVDVMNTSTSVVTIGFTASNWIIKNLTDIQKRDLFELKAKEYLGKMSRQIAISKYMLDLDAIPTTIKNRLDNPDDQNGWVIKTTWAQIIPYVINKELS